ncbi:MAG: fabH [Acidimicrobiales bacterium]|nr:fabH [Acidimicrobiales bacterium]
MTAIAPAGRRLDAPPALLPARFLGVGSALPDGVVTNAQLEARLDTTDTWIRERTGILERRVHAPGDTTVDLAVTAGRRALEHAGVDPSAVDLVVLATSTPDTACPASSSRVQAALGTSGAAFDLNAACAGFAYALHVGAALLADPAMRHVLVIGADRFTSVVDPEDRGTTILFGDGAGAVLLGRVTDADRADLRVAPGVLGADLGGDGNGADILHQPPGERYIVMDGPELFRRATRALAASCEAALAAAGATAADVDLFVPHQANARIITATANRLGIPAEQVVVNIDRLGNTAAASVPLALAEAHADGRLVPGSRVLLAGIGAGLAWASLYIRWAA